VPVLHPAPQVVCATAEGRTLVDTSGANTVARRVDGKRIIFLFDQQKPHALTREGGIRRKNNRRTLTRHSHSTPLDTDTITTHDLTIYDRMGDFLKLPINDIK
jgi:hypothetical protein